MASRPTGELSSCGLCKTLSDDVRAIKITYHVCGTCDLQDYEIVKKGTVVPTTPAVAAAPVETGKVASNALPPRRMAEIKSVFRPEGYFPA